MGHVRPWSDRPAPWAWRISWTPFAGIFIARISRGRTIRQFVTGADSASIVMGGLSENGTTDPSRFTVVFWGVATGGVASAMLLRHSLANQVLVDSVTTAVTTANEPHEVETIELHTSLSSTTDGDDAGGEGCQDSTDEAAQDLSADIRAVDGAENAPTGSERRQEG